MNTAQVFILLSCFFYGALFLLPLTRLFLSRWVQRLHLSHCKLPSPFPCKDSDPPWLFFKLIALHPSPSVFPNFRSITLLWWCLSGGLHKAEGRAGEGKTVWCEVIGCVDVPESRIMRTFWLAPFSLPVTANSFFLSKISFWGEFFKCKNTNISSVHMSFPFSFPSRCVGNVRLYGKQIHIPIKCALFILRQLILSDWAKRECD